MIVVTGATGNVGRPLVRALSTAGAQVTAVSRRPAAQDLPPGVRHHAADLAEPGRLKTVLDGADALFLLLAGELVVTGGDAAGLLDVARAGGVRQVVLLSSLGTQTRPGAVSFAGLRAAEDAVRHSGADRTRERSWAGRPAPSRSGRRTRSRRASSADAQVIDAQAAAGRLDR